jgi:hypothetical protein
MFPEATIVVLFVFLGLVMTSIPVVYGWRKLFQKMKLPQERHLLQKKKQLHSKDAQAWQLIWLRDDYARGRITIEQLNQETDKILYSHLRVSDQRILEILPPDEKETPDS